MGDPGSMTGLGYMYLNGIGVETNLTHAHLLFRKGATHGDATAQFYVGLLYLNGIATKQSNDMAYQYFMAAAHKGHAQSLYYAGYMANYGLSTAKSCKMAVQLFKLSVEKSHIANIVKKARSHYLKEEYDKAMLYYSIASEQGFETAQSSAAWLLQHNTFIYGTIKWFGNVTQDTRRKAGFRYVE